VHYACHELQEEYEFFEECFFDANGKPVLSNTTAGCDIKITGVDKQVRDEPWER
jgi:hypothetical protein